MITLLPESHGSTIGLKIQGKLTHDAYMSILPKLEHAIKQHGTIQLLLEINDFRGWQIKAAFDDLVFAFKNRHKIDRVAIVCDRTRDIWVSLIDQPFAKGTKGREKYFKPAEKEAAWVWLKRGKNIGGMPESNCMILKADATEKEAPLQDIRLCLITGQSPLRFFAAGILDRWKLLKHADFAVLKSTATQTPKEIVLRSDAIQIVKRLQWFTPLIRLKGLVDCKGETMTLKVSIFEQFAADQLNLGGIRTRNLDQLKERGSSWQALFSKGIAKNYKHVLWMDPVFNPNEQLPHFYPFNMNEDHFSEEVARLWDAVHLLLRQPEN